MKESFSNRLVRLMSERGLTIREVAKKSKVSPSTLQNWRSGYAPTDYEALKALADILGVSMEFLLVGSNTQAAPSLTITEAFEDGGTFFDGYLEVKIKRMIPRRNNKGGDSDQ